MGSACATAHWPRPFCMTYSRRGAWRPHRERLRIARRRWAFPILPTPGWRLWALGKCGRADVIVKDLRERWATLDSVRLNNTLQENWHVKPDSNSEWSHCPVIPLYIPTMSLAGIKPLAPGFGRCEIRPQLADLDLLELTANTVKRPNRIQRPGNQATAI